MVLAMHGGRTELATLIKVGSFSFESGTVVTHVTIIVQK